jgi:hypothetical protein
MINGDGALRKTFTGKDHESYAVVHPFVNEVHRLFFCGSSRFGEKSLASMEAETSIASTMSMPSVVIFVSSYEVCGRARATNKRSNASTRRTGSSFFKVAFSGVPRRGGSAWKKVPAQGCFS